MKWCNGSSAISLANLQLQLRLATQPLQMEYLARTVLRSIRTFELIADYWNKSEGN